MSKRQMVDIGKARVVEELTAIINELNMGNILVVSPKEDTTVLVNGIKTLLKDDNKIEEIARRIWGF